MIPFGEWLPDLEPLANPGALVAKNVVPSARSYSPVRSMTPYLEALPSRPLAALGLKDGGTGNILNFAMTQNAGYRLVDGAWVEIFNGITATLDSAKIIYYNRYVLFSCSNDLVRAYDIDLGVVTVVAGSPRARAMGVVRDFVVAGYGNKVEWSGNRKPLDWVNGTAVAGDDAAIDTRPVGGAVTAIASGERGLVFCENAIYLMTLTLGASIFQFDLVDKDHGCIVGGSMAQYRNWSFYLSDNGWYLWDGAGSVPIGYGKVNKWFFQNVDESRMDQMRSCIDPIGNRFIATFVSRNASRSDACDMMLFYDYLAKRWSYAEMDTTLIYPAVSEDASADGALFGGTLSDTIPIPVDSRQFIGGKKFLSLFDTSFRGCSLTGGTLKATLQTGEVQVGSKNVGHLKKFVPIIDSAESDVFILHKMHHHEQLIRTQAQRDAIEPFYYIDRKPSRYARGEIVIPVGTSWTYAMGIEEFDIPQGGVR